VSAEGGSTPPSPNIPSITNRVHYGLLKLIEPRTPLILLIGAPASACAAGKELPVKRPIVEPNAAAGVVREFLTAVRSGIAPERATDFMAVSVRAHQVTAENEATVVRTPEEYARHVHDMLATYGAFSFEVTELLCDGDRVYARWRQVGKHLAAIDEFAPTGATLTEIASAVYRVERGRIVEYWIQIDREGLRLQLEANARLSRGAPLSSTER